MNAAPTAPTAPTVRACRSIRPLPAKSRRWQDGALTHTPQ
jgi:hypothetical protein